MRHREDAALARHQRVAVIAEPRDVGGERRHSATLSAATPDHGGELVDPLQRLAIAAGERSECRALVLAEGFAHRRNQECAP